jgi:hypothetical protein
MGGRVRIALASGLASAACAAALLSGAWASNAPNTDWSRLLPALPSSDLTQPGAVKYCERPRLRCIGIEFRRLKRLRNRLGCDHRAVFATTYLQLTKTLHRTVRDEPRFFKHPRYLFTQDALFANVYFRTVRAWNRGAGVAKAWRIAFAAARDSDVNAAQDMLLGINAHVQNDMPFVIAALGIRTRKGASRKVDHDRVNEVLNRAYEPVVSEVKRRYDPIIELTNSPATPLDDIAGLELTRGWREGVWRNAERLVNARSAGERRSVARQVKEHAAAWARLIASFETPGYRAERDSYCRTQLSG